MKHALFLFVVALVVPGCVVGTGDKAELDQASLPSAIQKEIDALYAQSLENAGYRYAFSNKRKWLRILELDPEHKQARIRLDLARRRITKSQAERLLAIADREKKAPPEKPDRPERLTLFDVLGQSVSINIEEPIPLSDFLTTLSLISGLTFDINAGGAVSAQGAFDDTPLKSVLNQTLQPCGLKWRIDANTIVVEPDIQLRYFEIEPRHVPLVRLLVADGTLARMLTSRQPHPPMPEGSLRYDKRLNVLIAIDTALNLERLDPLRTLRGDGYEVRVYEIRPEDGPKAKALLDTLFSIGGRGSVFRKTLVDGSELFVRETPAHLKIADEVLADSELLAALTSGVVEIGSWIVKPQDQPNIDAEAMRSFFAGVVEVIETRLYAQNGKEAAPAVGRRLWADEPKMKITITDTPERIAAIDEYIRQLGNLERETHSRIIFLRHAEAPMVARKLRDVLGLPNAPDTADKNTVTRYLRQGDDFVWRDLFVRLNHVEDNHPANKNDDAAEFFLCTSVSEKTSMIREPYVARIGDANGAYAIKALHVDPSSQEGKGRARIEISYFESQTP